jgi:hypothetical protein
MTRINVLAVELALVTNSLLGGDATSAAVVDDDVFERGLALCRAHHPSYKFRVARYLRLLFFRLGVTDSTPKSGKRF